VLFHKYFSLKKNEMKEPEPLRKFQVANVHVFCFFK
jgi:hypothetical protein